MAVYKAAEAVSEADGRAMGWSGEWWVLSSAEVVTRSSLACVFSWWTDPDAHPWQWV